MAFNIGGSSGGFGWGATYGKRINEKNILEANYKSWSNRKVEGLSFSGPARVIYNGFGVGASNKYFFYDSFNIRTGLLYRSSTLDIPQGLDVLVNGKVINEREISEINGEISIGNHWFGENWGFGVDWITYSPTLLQLNEVEGFNNNNLQVLNLTLSYNF